MKYILALAAALSLGASVSGLPADRPDAQPVAAATAAAPSDSEIDRQIGSWIETLSAQDEFARWGDEQTDWRKYALGPGQHGWVVIVQNNGEEIGYLIAAATADGGIVVQEYGLGEMPLFSLRTLSLAMTSDGLEGVRFTARASASRLYIDAMQAVWKVTEGPITRYADAKTGAWLPIDESDFADALGRQAGSDGSAPRKSERGEANRIGTTAVHIRHQPADPYAAIGWLDAGAAPANGWNDFAREVRTNGGEMVYVSQSFGGKTATPLGVAGYHWWSGWKFVIVEHEGWRYIPLETLLETGSFRQLHG